MLPVIDTRPQVKFCRFNASVDDIWFWGFCRFAVEGIKNDTSFKSCNYRSPYKAWTLALSCEYTLKVEGAEPVPALKAATTLVLLSGFLLLGAQSSFT